jgi:hypothetical protein
MSRMKPTTPSISQGTNLRSLGSEATSIGSSSHRSRPHGASRRSRDRPARCVEVARVVSEHAQSGQSAAKFCRERGLRVWQFYEWKKRSVEADGAGFVAVEVKLDELAAPYSAPGDKAIEIRLRRGRSLIVGRGFDASHLRALLAVLESEG